jgi:hypothetical protein
VEVLAEAVGDDDPTLNCDFPTTPPSWGNADDEAEEMNAAGLFKMEEEEVEEDARLVPLSSPIVVARVAALVLL